MSNIKWSYVKNSQNDTNITFYNVDGETIHLTSAHSNFDIIKDYLDKMDTMLLTDEEHWGNISALYNVAQNIYQPLIKLSERFKFNGEELLFDGDIVKSEIIDLALNRLKKENQQNFELVIDNDNNDNPNNYDGYLSELSAQTILNFLEKLYNNPSQDSIQSLWDFVTNHKLRLTPDGDFLAFKGLREDYTSVHSGEGIVNNKYYSNNYLNNSIGNVIEMPRSSVENNRNIGCSTGLHAGSFEYASNFSRGKLVIVSINPRDVVSVPVDSKYAKLRISRYTVVGEVKNDNDEINTSNGIYDKYTLTDDECDCEYCDCEYCDFDYCDCDYCNHPADNNCECEYCDCDYCDNCNNTTDCDCYDCDDNNEDDNDNSEDDNDNSENDNDETMVNKEKTRSINTKILNDIMKNSE